MKYVSSTIIFVHNFTLKITSACAWIRARLNKGPVVSLIEKNKGPGYKTSKYGTRQRKSSSDIEQKKHHAVSLTQFLCPCSLDKSPMFLAHRSHPNIHYVCRKNGRSESNHRWCIQTLSENISSETFLKRSEIRQERCGYLVAERLGT